MRKKFYTIAELANLYRMICINVENAGNIREKFSKCNNEDMKIVVEELFTKSMNTLGRFNTMIRNLEEGEEGLNMFFDYFRGIDKSNGNKKVRVK